MKSPYECLRSLAQNLGVELEYRDNWGRNFLTQNPVIRDIVEAKGFYLDPRLLDLGPQTITSQCGSDDNRVSFLIEVTSDLIPKLRNESSITFSELDEKFTDFLLRGNDGMVSFDYDEQSGLTQVTAPLPVDLAPGDYLVRISVSMDSLDISRDFRLILGPDKAYAPTALLNGERVAGIAVALYAARSDSNWGAGDFTDLQRIIDWAIKYLGVHFIGLNPLHALFNKAPYNCSPYMPSSRLFYNFIYIDVVKAASLISRSLSNQICDNRETMELARRLREVERVNYEAVSELKLHELGKIFDHFFARREEKSYTSKWNEFEDYTKLRGEDLERFSTFCVLREHFLSQLPDVHSWKQWPEEFRDPHSDAVGLFKASHRKQIQFYQFIQWIAEKQLEEVHLYSLQKGMLIGLYHDVALAVDPDGADSWSRPEFFIRGFRVGAPPDAFAPQGQDWGFQPPNSEAVKESGFSFLRESLRAASKYGGAVRIDHVMQIHHLFWIPENKKASDGVYVKDYETDLLNVLTLESLNTSTVIVGEDLGTLPFNFRDRLINRGILSYRIFYFERDESHGQIPFYHYPEGAIVSLSTHDLPTLAGFWEGLDVATRRKLGILSTDEEKTNLAERTAHKAKIIERLVNDGTLPAEVAHHAWESRTLTEDLHESALLFILRTPCRLALISFEDLFMDTRQQNLPGTTHEHPNWVTKAKFSLEELESNPEAVRMASKFKRLVEVSGRYFQTRN